MVVITLTAHATIVVVHAQNTILSIRARVCILVNSILLLLRDLFGY